MNGAMPRLRAEGIKAQISLGRPRTASGSTTLPLPAPGISREHTIKVTYHLYELR